MEGKNYYKFLLERYMNETASQDEIADLFQEIGKGEDEQGWEELILEVTQAAERDPAYNKNQWEPILQSILTANTRKEKPHKGKIIRWKWMAAAAVLLLCISSTYYLFNDSSDNELANTIALDSIKQNDITPGTDKAFLTLADGSIIILDSAAKGAISRQGNVTVINLEGQLAYNKESGNDEEVLYNTVTTPRGGQYQLVLADGSKVWLNAASSLRFPTAFVGNERRVELKGEGYFEVEHNDDKPFWVTFSSGNDNKRLSAIQVLGTHFNINSYEDESTVNTTLLEGSIKVINGPFFEILKPGQQTQLNKRGEIKVLDGIDTEEVVAWKNGKFQFGEAMDIEMIMRQLARWYDIEVEFRSKNAGHIGGAISRNVNVSKVLDMLEMTGAVKFQVEGRKVTVHSK